MENAKRALALLNDVESGKVRYELAERITVALDQAEARGRLEFADANDALHAIRTKLNMTDECAVQGVMHAIDEAEKRGRKVGLEEAARFTCFCQRIEKLREELTPLGYAFSNEKENESGD